MARPHRAAPAARSRSASPKVVASAAFNLLFPWGGAAAAAFVLVLLPLAWLGLKREVAEVGEAAASVYDRGLVVPEVPYQHILKEHSRPWNNTGHRHLDGMVLAYVTPWNPKGYDNAKRFRSKFTHVSPVWYELKRGTFPSQMQLVGGHNVDEEWIEEVRKDGSPLILPRFLLRGISLDSMLTQSDERRRALDLIVDECKAKKFDGVVFEAWSAWQGTRLLEVPELRLKAVEFVQALGMALHSTPVTWSSRRLFMQLVFVIPPPSFRNGDPRMITTEDLLELGRHVDGFSLMTYDFSNPFSPGPNAPIAWVQACMRSLLPSTHIRRKPDHVKHVSRKHENYVSGRDLKSLWAKDPEKDIVGKVLLGVNLYGNDYVRPEGGKAIVGQQYVDLLALHKPKLVWDRDSKEHFFDYDVQGEAHRVFYPTLLSLAFRLEEADLWGVGLSIWEIGQGLDYFFDLL